MKYLAVLLSLLPCFAIAQTPASPAPPLPSAQPEFLPCVIRGTVYAVEDTAAAEQEFVERLKTVSTNEQFREALRATTRPARRPAAGAVVTARGKLMTQTATTDAAGRYAMRVLVEEYEVSAAMPGTNQASASKLVYADRNRPRDLQLRDDMITIRGRVTGPDGKPIADAKVVAEQSIDSQTDEILPDRYTTTTGDDGTYELKGIEPRPLWQTAGFLGGGTGGDGFMTVVAVTAPGMKRQSMAVAPVTEARLPRARELLQTLTEMAERAGAKKKPRELAERRLPRSKGNGILDVNFALQAE